MTSYYIESDGNGGTTGGDGTEGNPFGTHAEMFASVTLVDGDQVYADGTNGPFLEQFSISNLTGVDFQKKPGTTATIRILNVASFVVDTPHDVGGASPFDTYKGASGTLPFSPTAVIENWDDEINNDQIRHGFLKSYGTLGDLRNNRGFHDNGFGTLLVSVPDGETAAGRTYYIGRTGDCVVLTNPTRVTFNDYSFELATESGAGNGYGFRVLGKCTNVTMNDCRGDGCQYHTFGSVGSGTDGFVLNNCRFGSAKAGNDSHFVVYTTADAIQGVVLNSPIFFNTPWLDVDGAALEVGSVTNFAAHHLSGATATPAGGIQINKMVSYNRGFNPTRNHYDFAFTATNTNHIAPTDPDDPSTYPIIVRDSTLGCHGVQVGGGSSSNAHIAFDRCRFDFDASSVTSGLSTNGHLSVQEGSGSESTLLLRSCTVSAKLNDVTSRALVTNHTGTGSIVLINTTVHMRNTTNNNAYLLYATSTGSFKAHGCVFSKAHALSTKSVLGGSVAAPFTDLDFDSNLYDTDLHTTFHDFTGTSKATWESTYDTNGVFDQDAAYADENTLEPAASLKALKNSTKPTGPTGINNRPYSMQYGAWQYGGVQSTARKLLLLGLLSR